MKKGTKILLLGIFTLCAIVVVMLLKPLPQDTGYHLFADRRAFAGIPNFANVLSNIFFLFIGLIGLCKLKNSDAPASVNRVYAILFTGIFLTGLGSAYYHFAPDNDSLVYDRIPMTLVFMSFLSATIAGWIDLKTGTALVIPLLILGAESVLWWHYTELKGAGDLRFYGFIQFYPMLIIPFIFLLFTSAENNKGLYLLIWVIAWYFAAKLFEIFDEGIFRVTHCISGHSLKHIAAAMATWYIVKFFERKYVRSAASSHS